MGFVDICEWSRDVVLVCMRTIARERHCVKCHWRPLVERVEAVCSQQGWWLFYRGYGSLYLVSCGRELVGVGGTSIFEG